MEYEDTGKHFQQATKYIRGSMRRRGLDPRKQPPPRKQYPHAINTLSLPPPTTSGGPPLWDVIRERRSTRTYGRGSLSFEQVAQLLWATQGTTLRVRDFHFRSAPSAGALYPIETYLVVNRVERIENGLYHFDPFDVALQQLKRDDYGKKLAHAALDQHMMEEAAVVFAWTAVVARSAWKYSERAYRYIYIDAGHIAQNLYLAATGLSLGCCTAGAFYDEEVENLIGVDGQEEIVLYLAAVGNR